MANNLFRLVPKVRLENKTGLGSGTADVAIFHLESEDRVYNHYLIIGDAAPGTNFDDVPAGSLFIDKTNINLYIKRNVSGWYTVTRT